MCGAHTANAKFGGSSPKELSVDAMMQPPKKKQQHLLPRRPPNNSIIIDDNCDTMACSWGEGEPLPKRLNQPMHSAESTHSNATGTDG